MSPLEISIAMHYMTHADAFEPSTELHDQIVAQFIRDGILMMHAERDRPYTSKYEGTNKGRAWLELICATPYPIQKWIDPRNNTP